LKLEEKLNRRTMGCINHLKPSEALMIEKEKQKALKRCKSKKSECSD
jgi:hypothetical protein